MDAPQGWITTDELNVAKLIERTSAPNNGGTAVFIGTVRDVNQGRPVSGLEYSAYEEMAGKEMVRIVNEASAQFGTRDVLAVHRVGILDVGEICVVVIAAHPHRDSAFSACRYMIEEIKQRVPIWKREQYADGARAWLEGNDSAARGVDPARG